MREPDSLDALLREWKGPEPTPEMDDRVVSAYRTSIHRPPGWRRFWSARISVPAPVLVAAALALVALFLLLRPAPRPALSPAAGPPASPGTSNPAASNVVTQLGASGFQPLPNGDARVISVKEVH